MSLTRDRVLSMVGLASLVGMGILLLVSGREMPRLPLLAGDSGGHVVQLVWPGLLILLTVILAIVLGLIGRVGLVGRSGRRIRLYLALGLLALMLAVAFGAALPGSGARRTTERYRRVAAELESARTRVEALESALDRTGRRIQELWESAERPREAPPEPAKGFAVVQRWPGIWSETSDLGGEFPLRCALWRGEQRSAWTRGTVPLDPGTGPADVGTESDPGPSGLEVLQHPEGGLLRRTFALSDGWWAELQVVLRPGALAGRWAAIELELLPNEELPLRLDDEGEEIPDAVWSDANSGWSLRLIHGDWRADGADDRSGVRGVVAAVTIWVVLLPLVAPLLFGRWSLAPALWCGRGLLAAVGYFRLLGPVFDFDFPARPAAVASLVDPAYFATPFLFGGFASTADALVSAALLAWTVVWLLRRGRALRIAAPGGVSAPQVPGPLRALALGILTTGVLTAIRVLVFTIADNSNARLIGDGISLSSISFWALHTVLMLASLGLMALIPLAWRTPAVADLTGSGRLAGRAVTASLLAGTAAVLAGAPLGDLTWPARLATGAIAVAAYWVVPLLRDRTRFLRRLAWPVLLVFVVGWNYLALAEVYERAERTWLERKGELITESAEDWMLYLLQDALEGMVAAEADLAERAPRDDELWRDETAYRLWEGSALKDLGYSCLIELIAPDESEESLFATGQMRNFEFKVAGRTPWTDAAGRPPEQGWTMVFQTEERVYADGRETVLAGEAVRDGGRGWIRVEVPVRSDRLSSLRSDLAGPVGDEAGAYRPRPEVDRPVLLLRGGPGGWRSARVDGYPDEAGERRIARLRAGERTWAEIEIGDSAWLCRWESLPADWSEGPDDGFLIGVSRPGLQDRLLDLSRLLLLNLLLFFLLVWLYRSGAALARRWAPSGPSGTDPSLPRRPGFQERFLAGYLLLGLVLLVVVGASVDQVGRERIAQEARQQTLDGLGLAVQQMRSLLVEQARSLAGSEYIGDLLLGELAGQRPVGPFDRQQGMVFDSEGGLLLDETLSDLRDEEAAALLEAGRASPFLIVREGDRFYAATVIPIDLSGIWAAADLDSLLADSRHGADDSDGFFLYRQRLDPGLLGGLAELARGEATLRYDGRPAFASHPADIFAGSTPLLLAPERMRWLLEHPHGPAIFAAPDRPFAYTGCQPLPSFGRDEDGRLGERLQPAVLALAFPDRAREFRDQRRGTVLFLAGLANLILLTALVLALLLSWNIFRPLRLLLAATRSLARGDFGAPLPEAGGDEVGRLADAFGSMRGELQSARDRLAARERFLSAVLDRVSVGVAVLDPDGAVVTVNPAGREILADFTPTGNEAERSRDLRDRFLAAADGASRWAGEMRSADGRRTLRGAIAPLELPGERTDTMLVFEDVTEFLQTKMMAVNAELARQVAHEIKNPLTPIQLSIQLLDQAWRDGHEQLDRIVRDTVQRVLEQVALLRTIAAEFSLLGRPGDLELEPLDLAGVVRRCTDAYVDVAAAERGSAPRVEIAASPPVAVLGEAESLQKILGNLMQNSLDAAGDEPAWIEVDWVLGPETVTLRWRDHGSGISDEVADRLFDPYFSTKSSGTGLGLAICRNLVDRMGGRIELGPPPAGAGALVELTLPLAPKTGDVE